MMKKFLVICSCILILLGFMLVVGNLVFEKQISEEDLKKMTSGEWNEAKKVNAPNLLSGMQAIYFDEDGNEILLTEKSTEAEWNNWYDYNNGKWANAKTIEDGSYWVWIPRYAYKITDKYGETFEKSEQENSYIDVKFVDNKNSDGVTTYLAPTNYESLNTSTDYYVHPVFIKDDDATLNGESKPFNNGGWDSDLSGFWVAKFEMSMENNKKYVKIEERTMGNVLTDEEIRMVSKPNVSSWIYVQLGNVYTNALNYDKYVNNEKLDSHLIKNSEWGAVTYLSNSIYGLNGKNICVNSNKLTGGGAEWNTLNVAQSTTGNVTGVYDIAGCSWERTSSYVATGDKILEENGIDLKGSCFASTEKNPSSTKYVTVYNAGKDKTPEALYFANNKKGDAIRETSNGFEKFNSWYGGASEFSYGQKSFFKRGGTSERATAFSFSSSQGCVCSPSFRICLAPSN